MSTSQQPKALRLADDLESTLRWHDYMADDPCAQAVSELRRLHAENEAMRAAIKKLHSSRGRYHTQLAACDLYEMCNLPTVRPTK